MRKCHAHKFYILNINVQDALLFLIKILLKHSEDLTMLTKTDDKW